MTVPKFPKISDEARLRLLEPPRGPSRIVIDTDAKNEIDDQFALTWALLSPDILEIEAVYAEPFSSELQRENMIKAYELRQQSKPLPQLLLRYEALLDGLAAQGVHPRDVHYDGPDIGMERSYEEILLVYEKLRMDPAGKAFRGSERYLSSLSEPVESPAALDLIERALTPDDRPLYVHGIGCVTNIASAMLMEPEIIRNIVVVWTSGYPTNVTQVPNHSFNLEQDMLASQLLFDSGVPLVYLPGYHIGAQLRVSLPEVEAWVRGRGAIGDYLYEIYYDNPGHRKRAIRDHFGRTWVMWDLINIAWMINPDWAPSILVPTPVLGDDKVWQHNSSSRPLLREAYAVDRDAIYRDFFKKLENAPD